MSNALLAAAQQGLDSGKETFVSWSFVLFCFFFLKKKTANLRGKEVPHIYTVIKEWVLDQKKREKPRPYFVWDSFVEAFPGYDPYLLERACEFLHDMGVLFLAKRSIGNKRVSLVCVDIQWLAKVARFSCLLDEIDAFFPPFFLKKRCSALSLLFVTTGSRMAFCCKNL